MNSSKVYLEVVILGFIKVLLMNINMSVVFCWSLVGSYYIRFNFRRGVLAVGSSVGSLVNSLVDFFFTSSSASLLGFSGLSYRYGFTAMVLKLVNLLESCTLYISPSILSNLNGLIHLPLCLILFFYYISISELRGRLWIVVTDGLFC